MSQDLWLLISGVMPSAWAYQIRHGVQTAGRSPECAVHLVDPTVSRQHAQIVVIPDCAFVRDLHSRNGTFVNGIQVEECKLVPGDSLKLGRVMLAVVSPTEIAQGGEGGLEPTDSERVGGREVHGRIPAGLTRAQRQILEFLVSGLSEKQIASRLFVSQETVHTHVKAIYRSFSVHSRAELSSVCHSLASGAGIACEPAAARPQVYYSDQT